MTALSFPGASLDEAANRLKKKAQRLQNRITAALRNLLSTPITDLSGRLLEYYVEHPRALRPGERALQQQLCAAVRQRLAIFPRRQEIALRYRFGIEMEKERTLQEIGDMFVVTRERVRQIERQALRRLRRTATRKPRREALSDCFSGTCPALKK
jgi:RNA polymerase primary sigma factor